MPLDRALHLENALRWLNDPEITASLEQNLGVTRRQEEAFFERMEAQRDTDFVWADRDGRGPRTSASSACTGSSGGTARPPAAWSSASATPGAEATRATRSGCGPASPSRSAGLHRIEGHTMNPAMRRVYEKCGYRHEGVARQKYWRGGRWVDADLYAILDEDYFAAATAPDPSVRSRIPDQDLPDPGGPAMSEGLVRAFHRHFYDQPQRTWDNTTWLGVKVLKCPLDAWIYQEILWETRPDLIVECGTRFGGSAYYLATLCDLMGRGEVLTIDIDTAYDSRPNHPRITYLAGSSVAAPDRGAGAGTGRRPIGHGDPRLRSRPGARLPGTESLRPPRDVGLLPRRGGHQSQRPPRLPRVRAGAERGPRPVPRRDR